MLGMHLAGRLTLLPDGHGWLLVEFGGDTKDEADERGARADGRSCKTAGDAPPG